MKRKVKLSLLRTLSAIALPFCLLTSAFGSQVVNSPHGNMPEGARAESPDGRYYVQEQRPYGQGRIAVVTSEDGKREFEWDLGERNDIKILGALYANPKFGQRFVAVTHHGGDVKSKIYIFEVGSKNPVDVIDGKEWFHHLKLDKDRPDLLKMSENGYSWETFIVKGGGLHPEDPKPEEKLESFMNSGMLFVGRKDAVFSEHGSVPYGQKAFSKCGRYYAMELEPHDQGEIGIFEKKTDKLLQKFDLLPNTNDLKGMAWAGERPGQSEGAAKVGPRLAVMYHGGVTPGVMVVELEKEGLQAAYYIDKFYHYIVFDEDNKTLLMSKESLGMIDKVVPEELDR